MKKFTVVLTAHEVYAATTTIEAETQQEAEQIAFDDAESADWESCDSGLVGVEVVESYEND